MKFTLSCIFICMNVCLARNMKPKKNILRIIGGRNSTDDEYPYVVKLMLQSLASRTQKNVFICSCSVLTPKWTLTAGHCITGMEQIMITTNPVQTKAVIEYQPTPKADAAYSEVVNTAIHPGAKMENLKNDIALLYTQPVLFARYGKLSPIDYETLNGQEVAVVGYGVIENYHEDPPRLPQVLDVVVKECPSAFHYPQICFAPACSATANIAKSVCPGDSGGPAVHASGIVSVNSKTDARNCGWLDNGFYRRERYDLGYDAGSATPVSPFVDWISSVMNTEISL